ncbi:endo alpha-1,4 polygalactosaminidase [Phycicoccus sp. MAQZ13P-2]|uniref:endo alpha-1,4 polygalactosaminidase n=1 Tax=Phycicoccus mangrovi TaxID=2840470 RepID=UPI001BFFE27C|nr:endo alpha-1,4 polygalactosaminidase [Phycicoccus mangrovi]MBT9257111.1 endo alpha-1,4 polygalactosaminidase [Phycicoccus mangrovi]MBT9275399.1 endo alpha-1,4 polygalactosaminidase [Phycicoccus mangrovi]
MRSVRAGAVRAALGVVALLCALGCSTTAADPSAPGATTASPHDVRPLPRGGGVDYQLGGPSAVPAGVEVVVRDRTDPPAGAYPVCYVNAFQAQPDATDWWITQHPGLVLRHPGGTPVVDAEWDEVLLDLRPHARAELLSVLTPWVQGCAAAGFSAVELDNLDSWTRSDGMLTADDALALATDLAAVAHGAGLAVGQKNAVELTDRLARTVTDFAVVEECGRYDECGPFVEAYDGRVVLVEYDDAGLAAACATWADLRPVLRDLDLVAAGESGYVRRECPAATR